MNNRIEEVIPLAQGAAPRRRQFLAWLSIVLGALAASAVAIPSVGLMLGPVLRKRPKDWRKVGPVESFPIGQTVAVSFRDASALPWDGVSAYSAAWLRRETDQKFVAFSINCTHLGCPVRWMPEANLFMCPCHGGVYYSDGLVAAGPPPKPLPRYAVRVREGQVEIETGPIPLAFRNHASRRAKDLPT